MDFVHKTINVDKEYWHKLPDQNRSDVIRRLIKDYVNAQEENTDEISAELLKIELGRIDNEIIQLTTKRDSYLVKLRNIEEMQEKQREEQLEQEKINIEQAKKCIGGCGRTLEPGHKSHNFNKGAVCEACYSTARPVQIKEWMDIK